MYDLVIARKLNKKKVALVLIIAILLVSIPTILGIKVAQTKEEVKKVPKKKIA